MFQSTGGDGASTVNDFGDLSVVLKYAFINDRHTGNVLSGGLVITAPTGPSIDTIDGRIHDWHPPPFAKLPDNRELKRARGMAYAHLALLRQVLSGQITEVIT